MLIYRLLNLLPVLFRLGTFLGKDKLYKSRMKRDIGPFCIAELSAADRQMLLTLARNYYANDQTTDAEKELQFIGLRLQAIAASARNKRGYILFDPMKKTDLDKVSKYPQSVLNKALDAIADISGLPFLRTAPEAEDPEVNPS